MCGMSGISGTFSPDLLFLSPANSRAMEDFIPLIPHIPHPSGETASRSQSSNLLTDTQIAGYDVSAIYAWLIRHPMACLNNIGEADTARLLRALQTVLVETTREIFRDGSPEERENRLAPET